MDAGLRGEIKLFEEFRRYRYTAGGLYLSEGSLGVMAGIQMLMIPIAVRACLVINIEGERWLGVAIPLLKSFSNGALKSGVGAVRFSLLCVRSIKSPWFPPTPPRLISGPARFSLLSVLSRRLSC